MEDSGFGLGAYWGCNIQGHHRMGTEVAVEGNIAVEVAAGSPVVVDSQVAAAGSPVVVGSLADKPAAAVEDSHCMAAEGFVEDIMDFVVDSPRCFDKDCTVGFDCT